jgi:cation transport ATPase
MLLLIGAGYFKWLPGYLSDGMLLCAAVIGVFPLLKNAFFDALYKRRFRFELVVGLGLLAGLFTGRLLEVALLALLLLVGSFMRLNFSWKD